MPQIMIQIDPETDNELEEFNPKGFSTKADKIVFLVKEGLKRNKK